MREIEQRKTNRESLKRFIDSCSREDLTGSRFYDEILPRIKKKKELIRDWGCGPDRQHLVDLAERAEKVEAIDFSRHTAKGTIMDTEELPLNVDIIEKDFFDHEPEKPADVSTAVEVLSYYRPAEIKQILRKIISHTKPGGQVFFTFYAKEFLNEAARKGVKIPPERFRTTPFSTGDIKNLIEELGIKEHDIQSFTPEDLFGTLALLTGPWGGGSARASKEFFRRLSKVPYRHLIRIKVPEN